MLNARAINGLLMDVIWDQTPRARWDRLLEAAPHALQQAHAYGAAMQRLGAGVARAEIRRSGAVVGVAQVLWRRWFGLIGAGVCTRGPVWTAPLTRDEEAAGLRALARSARFGRWSRLIVTPETDNDAAPRAAGLRRVMTGYTAALFDLSPTLEAARARMKSKWRNRLVAAERAGWRVAARETALGDAAWLFAAERAQAAAKGYASAPPELARLYAEAAQAKGAATLFEARRGRKEPIAAAMLFLRHGSSATYHIGWSDDAGREGGAHNLLLWRAAEHFRGLGVGALDLGGVDTRRAPGLARFKLGSGAAPRVLSGTFT